MSYSSFPPEPPSGGSASRSVKLTPDEVQAAMATFAAQCLRRRHQVGAEAWKRLKDRVATLLAGAKDGDRDDPAALTSVAQTDMLVHAMLVADEAGVELRKDRGGWTCAAAELVRRLNSRDPDLLASLMEHVLVGGNVPRRDGKGKVRVIAGFP